MAHARLVMEVVRELKPTFHGMDPAIVGGVLGELVALWVAGHRSDVREAIVEEWLRLASALTAENAKQLWGDEEPALNAFKSWPFPTDGRKPS